MQYHSDDNKVNVEPGQTILAGRGRIISTKVYKECEEKIRIAEQRILVVASP